MLITIVFGRRNYKEPLGSVIGELFMNHTSFHTTIPAPGSAQRMRPIIWRSVSPDGQTLDVPVTLCCIFPALDGMCTQPLFEE